MHFGNATAVLLTLL